MSGACGKYECGNGPFPQISFYSQTLQFLKSNKDKYHPSLYDTIIVGLHVPKIINTINMIFMASKLLL